jgi:hypothetical protein
VGKPVTLLIRPEAARLADGEGMNQVMGVVTAVSFRGRYYQVWLDVGPHSLTFEVEEIAGWAVGEPAQLQLAAAGIMVYPGGAG